MKNALLHLWLCAISDPATCHADSMRLQGITEMQCVYSSQTAAADYAKQHPGVRVMGARCGRPFMQAR